MSFREKSAWISFFTVLLAATVYFGALALGLVHGFGSLHLLMACVVGLVVLQVALHAVAAMLSPADARTPKDEREKAIELQSFRVGYYVLVVAVMAMFVTGHMHVASHALVFHGLVALVLSTLAISLTQIVLFRLGR
jgi:hypothetical protein